MRRRIVLVLSASAITAMMLVASAGPALAIDFDDDDDDDRPFHRFGGFFDGFGDFDVENEAESGDVDISYEVSNEGDYAMQCVPALQFGQTGNLNNTPSFFQSFSVTDDFEAEGIEFFIEPTVEAECNQSVEQSSAASS